MNIKLLFFPLSMVILVWSIISYTKPAWDDYKIKKTEVIKLVAEKQKLEKGIMNIKKALGEYNSLQEDVKSYVNNAIPRESDDDNLIAEINKGVSQSGVLVAKTGFSKKRTQRVNPKCLQKSNINDENMSKLDCSVKASVTNVTLSLVGAYPSIKNFLGRLDTQNRLAIPTGVDISTSKSKNKDEDEEASDVELLTAKIQFDVLQKKPANIKSFSAVMSSDSVLKSLLSGGLNKAGIDAVNKFITSEVFIPVRVDGAGKEDIFKKTI